MAMKKFLILTAMLLSLDSLSAQEKRDSVLTEIQKDYAEANRFQIFPYDAVLVHLDTFTGRLKYVDYTDTFRKSPMIVINDKDLSENGRGNFTLYKVWPCLVLLDKTNGNTWQVELSDRKRNVVFRKFEDKYPK